MKNTKHLLVGAVAAVSSLLSAQGTYTSFGTSCPGALVCDSANASATANSNLTQNSNIFALLVPASPNVRVVTGFQLFTQLRGAAPVPITFNTQIYAADAAGAPTGAPLRSGTMAVTSGSTTWASTTFATPYILLANTKIFISYTSVASKMAFPIASAGTNVTHFWHPPNATTWNGTPPNGFRTQPWAWKLNCGGSGGPTLSNTGLPSINTTFSVDLAGAPPNANCLFAFGVSNTSWGSIPLPFDLTPLNAPGCSLYVSLDFQFGIQASGAGAYSFSLTVPNDATLKGFKFYNQYTAAAPNANGFGVAFTNGGAATIG